MVAWRWLIILALLVVLVALVLLLAPPGCQEVPTPSPTTTNEPPTVVNDGREVVTINGETFRLEVAADMPTRMRGLMYRESIPEDGGMLFIFPYPEMQSFWMANCLVDIDIIYLNADGRVTATHRMKALPPKGENESEWEYQRRVRATHYWSMYPAQFAIELKAGTLDRLNLSTDDLIELDLERLKAMAR
jgi:uncharacterized membrane protein (UPF0127 family)